MAAYLIVIITPFTHIFGAESKNTSVQIDLLFLLWANNKSISESPIPRKVTPQSLPLRVSDFFRPHHVTVTPPPSPSKNPSLVHIYMQISFCSNDM